MRTRERIQAFVGPVGRRLGTGIVVGSLLYWLAAVAPVWVAAAEPTLPAGLSDEVVISGLSLPTNVQFAPNGDIFVAEKAGKIKRFTSLTDTNPTLVADLRFEVYNYWDRGLLGLAVDPDYPTRPYIYALYSYDTLIGGTPQKWGTPTNNGNDDCPTSPGPGPLNDGCTATGRLVRLTLNSSGVMTSQKELIHDWCEQFPSHSIGTVAFGQDGFLYASGGDGASFSSTLDYGQWGGTVLAPNGTPYTPVNPCGDPPGGVGGNMVIPTARGGTLRSQSLRRPTSEPTVLDGTIIRIDPDTGNAINTNANYYGGRDENERRIVAYGLRNPFRFTFMPGTNELWIGDVGAGSWEEINRVRDPTNPPKNHAWPCYEALEQYLPAKNVQINMCETLYAAGPTAIAQPYFAYEHQKPLNAADTCATGGGVISGVAFNNSNKYPARYNGTLFMADYGRNCIWAMRAGTNGLPDSSQIEVLVKDAPGPVQLQMGPDGYLYYPSLDGGKIHRINFTGANQAPTVRATATPNSGPAPLTVIFDASNSDDPDGDPITVDWDLDGDGQYGDASGTTASKVYAAGAYSPQVKVSDNHGNSATKTFTITSGNSPPVPVIDTPADGFTWKVGQDIAFSGHATDSQDGNVPAARLSWQIVLHHCTGPAPADCHPHPITALDGAASGSFQGPDHEYPSYIEFVLTATDSQGLTATASRSVQPKSVALTFATSPQGLTLTAGGHNGPGPLNATFIVGSAISLSAPATQTIDGITYTFGSWSDGGARTHAITAPGTNTTYTATYTSSLPGDASNTCAGATSASSQGIWLRNTLASNTDQDWYRFTLASKSWVRVLLGNLPANYQLELYSNCGTSVASSNRANTELEEMYRELNAGTYRVRVRRAVGNVDTTVAYGLRFQAYATGLHILSSSSWLDTAGNLNIDGEILNNTPDRYRLVRVEATYYDSSNNELSRAASFGYINIMRGRTRGPFRISVPKPAAYHHYSVAISYTNKTTDFVVQNLAFGSPTVNNGASLRFQGSLTNNNTFSTAFTQSVTALYDKWGVVINTDVNWTSPMSFPVSGTGTYDVLFTEHFTGWNRSLILLQATKGT